MVILLTIVESREIMTELEAFYSQLYFEPPESDKENSNASFVVYCKHNFWVHDNTETVSMTPQHFDFPAFEVTANPSLLTG